MGIKYIWDTNTVIYFLQQQFPPRAEKFMDNLINEARPVISAITEIELLCWKSATENALYANLNFKYQSHEAKNGYFSNIHEIHNNTVPLNKNATIAIQTKNIDERFQSKALIVNIDPETGKYRAVGGKYENGRVEGEIKNFGNYAVRIDTVPPTILLLSITNKNTLTETNRIRFEITDDLAGIDQIEGLIDGVWALFEYDAKSNTITHNFDTERFELNKQHQFKLTVTDTKGNSSEYEATFQK